MRFKFRVIKNWFCRVWNENIRNIGKNNGFFNVDGKGRMGIKEYGLKRSWDLFWDNKCVYRFIYK